MVHLDCEVMEDEARASIFAPCGKIFKLDDFVQPEHAHPIHAGNPPTCIISLGDGRFELGFRNIPLRVHEQLKD